MGQGTKERLENGQELMNVLARPIAIEEEETFISINYKYFWSSINIKI